MVRNHVPLGLLVHIYQILAQPFLLKMSLAFLVLRLLVERALYCQRGHRCRFQVGCFLLVSFDLGVVVLVDVKLGLLSDFVGVFSFVVSVVVACL